MYNIVHVAAGLTVKTCTRTGGDDGVGRQLAHVTVVPLVDVLSRAVVTQQLVVVRASIARPLGHVTSVRVLAHRRVTYVRYVATLCDRTSTMSPQVV